MLNWNKYVLMSVYLRTFFFLLLFLISFLFLLRFSVAYQVEAGKVGNLHAQGLEHCHAARRRDLQDVARGRIEHLRSVDDKTLGHANLRTHHKEGQPVPEFTRKEQKDVR